MAFEGRGDFNGIFGISRRAMGDGNDSDHGRAIRPTLDSENDDAGTILAALFLTGLVLAVPKIRIGDNKASLGGGDRRHGPGLFRVEDGVEMRVTRVHP
jgi:hypothetical protein